MKTSVRLACVALAALAPTAVQGQLVTAPTPDMTNHVDQSCGSRFTGGPLDLGGGVTFTSSNSGAVVCRTEGYGLAANGTWNGAPGYAGLNASQGWMRFSFDNPVSGVGGFLNWAPTTGVPFLAALDASNNVIDEYIFADILTPNATNGGAFRGIDHATADIYAFELRNAFVVARDVVYSTQVTTTPEPASLVLLGTGLLGVVGIARRRARASSIA